jgi:hypothetical protein
MVTAFVHEPLPKRTIAFRFEKNIGDAPGKVSTASEANAFRTPGRTATGTDAFTSVFRLSLFPRDNADET